MLEDLDKFRNAIEETGFPLEYRVANRFERQKWTVMQSKYYIDDVAGAAREIDMLAYKVYKTKYSEIVTAVLVSCKKDSANAWGFLSKPMRPVDPNVDRYPMHLWTNSKILRYAINEDAWKDDYLEEVKNEPFYKTMLDPTCEIFAFQCMSLKNGKPQNDRAIFDSISSLMKAQSYEIEALRNTGRPKQRLYSFHLVTVADAQFVRLLFDGEEVESTSTSRDTYVGRHIVNKQETDVRVTFVTADEFDNVVKELDDLCQFNCRHFARKEQEFYEDPFANVRSTSVFSSDIEESLRFYLNLYTNPSGEWQEKFNLSLWWAKRRNCLLIQIDGLSIDDTENLNADAKFMNRVQTLVKDLYHYEGRIEIQSDLPF